MSTGEKCTNFHKGQAVAYIKYGTFSEYMVIIFFYLNKVHQLIKLVNSTIGI